MAKQRVVVVKTFVRVVVDRHELLQVRTLIGGHPTRNEVGLIADVTMLGSPYGVTLDSEVAEEFFTAAVKMVRENMENKRKKKERKADEHA
jgi:hypothetical protein